MKENPPYTPPSLVPELFVLNKKPVSLFVKIVGVPDSSNSTSSVPNMPISLTQFDLKTLFLVRKRPSNSIGLIFLINENCFNSSPFCNITLISCPK